MDYLLHLLILTFIFSILTVSLNLLVGHTGLFTIAHAAFFGLGAYSSAIVGTKSNAPFYIGFVLGIVLSIVFSYIISLATLRLHEDYFAIATFGFQMILFAVFQNWIAMTNGPIGIAGVPKPNIMGWVVQSHFESLVFIGVCTIACWIFINRLAVSAFGQVLRAIREDEIYTQALGKNCFRYKSSASAISGAMASLAGSLYAHHMTYINPARFSVTDSILILSMVIIGGAGSRLGPIVGAIILVTLPEALRFLGLPSNVAANLRQILYGSALIVCIIWRPQGLIGKFSFRKDENS